MEIKKYLLLLIITIGLFPSCGDTAENTVPEDTHNEKTLLMYMPWSSDLTSCFYQNIKDMEDCIKSMGGLSHERVLVFISENPTEASLFELKYENGKSKRISLKSYSNPAFTTKEGIAGILKDVIQYAPAKKYSMVIGCHGMGWLPVDPSKAKRSAERLHWEYRETLQTRYFGGTSTKYRTDISTLSAAISDTGLKMEYILFDDCYMSSIEVAYELKDAADFLIASTCEIMAYGMPYATMGKHLLATPDYKAICDVFYDFYSNYSIMPCGTLSVTDLSQIDAMAMIMKRINTHYTFDDAQRGQLQSLDGYSPTIFYDFGDYVNQLLEQNHAPQSLSAEFETQLNRLIPYKTNTEKFYTTSQGPIKINRYSGITTSDPSVNQRTADKDRTQWYYATH